MSNVPTLRGNHSFMSASGEDILQVVSPNGGGVSAWIDSSGRPQGNLFSSQAFTAQTPKTAVTTAVSLFNSAQNIGAGGNTPQLLNQASKVMSFFAAGVFTSSVTSQQLTFSVLLGGVSVLSIQGTAQAAAITNGQWELEGVIVVASTGASGTVEAHGGLSLQQSATLGTGLPFFVDQNTAVSSAINLTSNPLAFDIQIADTVSLTSITMRQALVEIYN